MRIQRTPASQGPVSFRGWPPDPLRAGLGGSQIPSGKAHPQAPALRRDRTARLQRGSQAQTLHGRWNRDRRGTNGTTGGPGIGGHHSTGHAGPSPSMGKAELQTDLQLYMRQINEIGLLTAVEEKVLGWATDSFAPTCASSSPSRRTTRTAASRSPTSSRKATSGSSAPSRDSIPRRAHASRPTPVGGSSSPSSARSSTPSSRSMCPRTWSNSSRSGSRPSAPSKRTSAARRRRWKSPSPWRFP